jgi:hypothetical protein
MAMPPPRRAARLPPPNRVLAAAAPRAQEGVRSGSEQRPRRIAGRALDDQWEVDGIEKTQRLANLLA